MGEFYGGIVRILEMIDVFFGVAIYVIRNSKVGGDLPVRRTMQDGELIPFDLRIKIVERYG
jgi:hypothetical protein